MLAFLRVLRSSSLPQDLCMCCVLYTNTPPPPPHQERQRGWAILLFAGSITCSRPQVISHLHREILRLMQIIQVVVAWHSSFCLSSHPQLSHPADELPISCQSTLESRYNPRWPHLACLTHTHLSNSHTKSSWSAWHILPTPSSSTRAQTSSISHPSVLYQCLAHCLAHRRSSTKYSPSE